MRLIVYLVFISIMFTTSCDFRTKKEKEFLAHLQENYDCNVSFKWGERSESGSEKLVYYHVTLSNCNELKGNTKAIASILALKIFKNLKNEKEFNSIKVTVENEDFTYRKKEIENVIKSEAYLLDVFNQLINKNYKEIYQDFGDHLVREISLIDFKKSMDSLFVKNQITGKLKLEGFQFGKEKFEQKNRDYVHLVASFKYNNKMKGLLELYVPKLFSEKIYGLNVQFLNKPYNQ